MKFIYLLIAILLIPSVSAISWSGGTTVIINQTINGSLGTNTNWPINTTVLQNQSGTLGIVDSFFQNLYLQIDNLFSTINNETWVDLGVRAGFNASGGGGGGASNLSELGDVNITSPVGGNSLVYNSTLNQWTNQDLTVDLTNTNYVGSDFSGSNGEVNRTLIIGTDIAIVVMERQTLTPNTDYAINSGVLNISLAVFDVFRITISQKSGLQFTNHIGTDLSGTNPNRYIASSLSPEIVVLERQTLRPTDDYTFNGTDVVFNIPVDDVMRFTIWT